MVTVSLAYPAVTPKTAACELQSYKRSEGCKTGFDKLIQIQCDSNGENDTCNATCDGDGVNGKDTTVTSKKPDSWSFVCCVVNGCSVKKRIFSQMIIAILKGKFCRHVSVVSVLDSRISNHHFFVIRPTGWFLSVERFGTLNLLHS